MNRQNLKNFLTLNYLKGIPNVYKIKSPNGQHYVLVNKNTFARNLLGRNNINSLNRMILKNLPYIARRTRNLRNTPVYFMGPNPNHHGYFNNFVRKENYVFRKWNPPYGMTTVRGPFGPIKLTNVNHYKLTPGNLRNLRGLRRQNVKNEQETTEKLANRLSKKMVQEVFRRNGLPSVWINSNGRKINAPSPSNINHYMMQGGRKMYPFILKSANRALSTYIRATPNLRIHFHYRMMHIKK